MPTIVRHPNKTHYLVGSDNRIDLTRTTDGNPEANYLWYKDNQLEAISTNKTLTFTDVAATNSGLYTCDVSNTFNDVINTKRVQIHVCIIKDGHKIPVYIVGNRGKLHQWEVSLFILFLLHYISHIFHLDNYSIIMIMHEY